MTRAELLRIALAHALGKLRYKRALLGISEELRLKRDSIVLAPVPGRPSLECRALGLGTGNQSIETYRKKPMAPASTRDISAITRAIISPQV